MVPIEHVYDQIRAFAADAGARKVVLFGSRAKGVNRPKSDIDLAVAGCSKPLSNITISWTNRCGCACCAIAMILLISMMKNELGVLWTPSSLITSPSLSVQIRGWSLATVKH